MKVLRKGEIWNDFEQICGHCNALLKVERHDVKRYGFSGDVRDGTPSIESWYGVCCECGTSFRIEDSRVPYGLKQELRGKLPPKSEKAW